MKKGTLFTIVIIAAVLSLGTTAGGMGIVLVSPDEPRTVSSGGTIAVPCEEVSQFSGAVDAVKVSGDSESAVYSLEGYGIVRVDCASAAYDVLLTDWQPSPEGADDEVQPHRAAIFDPEGFRADPDSFENRLYVLATLIRREGPDSRSLPSQSSSWIQIAAADWLRLDHPQWVADGEQLFTGLVEVCVDDDGTWFLTAHQQIENLTADGFSEPHITLEDGAFVLQKPTIHEIPVGTLLYAALRQTRSSGMRLVVHGDAVETVHYQSYLGSFQELVLLATRPGSADIEILYSRYGDPIGERTVSYSVY